MPVLVGIAATWLLGLIISSGAQATAWQAPVAVAALGAGGAIAVWGLLSDAAFGAPRWMGGALAAAALAAGLSVGPEHAAPVPLPPAGTARLDAVVEDVRHGADGSARSLVRVLRGTRLSDDAAVTAGTRLWVAPYPLPEHARVRLLAKLSPSVPFRNPTPHPRTPQVMPAQGKAWLASPEAVDVREHSLPARSLDALRRHVRGALDESLSARPAAMARALLLADPDVIADEELDVVRRSGLVHVIAVSGLHVAILAGLLVALVRRALLRLPLAERFDPRRIACALGVPLALAVAGFTGGVPSGWRAAVTAALGWTLVALGRRPSPGAVTALTVMLLGALRPHEAARPGFLLSITATAAILSGPHIVTDDLASYLRAALALSWRTAVATAPIVLWLFGAVPLVGVAANVLLVPVGSALLVLAAAHAAVASTLPFASALTAAPFAALSDAFVAACEVFARLGPDHPWPPPDVPQGVAITLGAVALLLVRGWRHGLAVVLATAVVVGALELRLRHVERPLDRLRVTFLDVGQGDAALVDLPDGRLMLIDAGGNPGGGADPGAAAIVPLLAARRRDRIDIAVLTHPHPDHYGGLAAVLDAVPVGELWDSGQAEGEADLGLGGDAAAELLRKARTLGTRVMSPADLCNRAVVAGEARIRVLAPCPAYDSGYDANDNSLVVRVDYRARSFLFTGDAEAHAEATLLATAAPLRADVLKVGHHGSRTSTSEPFLRAVAPRLAVISAGAANRFGHPHADVRERLERSVPHVLSLAETGGAIVESDGDALRVETWSGDRVVP